MLEFQSLPLCFLIPRCDKCIVRPVQILDDIQRKILHPCHKRIPKMLRRLLCDGHDIGAQLFRLCNDNEFALLFFCHSSVFTPGRPALAVGTAGIGALCAPRFGAYAPKMN